LGTIRDLINNSGSIIDHIDFSAFGTVLDQSDPSEGDRMMGFAGMELDSVTGMNLAVNRVQNPGTGRWTSQDPLGFGAGDADLYRYVGNEPEGLIDPSGLDAVAQLQMPDIPKNPFAPLPPPDRSKVTDISKRIIAEMKKDKRKFASGPCGSFAGRMGTALTKQKIKFNIRYYNVVQPGGGRIPQVWYTLPDGSKISVPVIAKQHIIVEVEVNSGGELETILLDAGNNYMSNGNFGDNETGVIDPRNQNLNDVNTGMPLLKECDPFMF
jgi:RHS repeat-associated protein